MEVKECRYKTNDGTCNAFSNPSKPRSCEDVPLEWCKNKQYLDLQEENKKLKENFKEEHHALLNSRAENYALKTDKNFEMENYKCALKKIKEIAQKHVTGKDYTVASDMSEITIIINGALNVKY